MREPQTKPQNRLRHRSEATDAARPNARKRVGRTDAGHDSLAGAGGSKGRAKGTSDEQPRDVLADYTGPKERCASSPPGHPRPDACTVFDMPIVNLSWHGSCLPATKSLLTVEGRTREDVAALASTWLPLCAALCK